MEVKEAHVPAESKPSKEAAVEEKKPAVDCPFRVKQTVSVEARTYPGMNKHGGVGRVMKINADGTVNVKYILGGSEKNLDLKYVSAIDTNAKHVREKKKREIYEPPVELARRRNLLKRPAEHTSDKVMKPAAAKRMKNASSSKSAKSVKIKKMAPKTVKLVKLKKVKSKKQHIAKAAASSSVDDASQKVVETKASEHAKEIERVKQAEFRRRVSKVFQNEDTGCLPSEELLSLINEDGASIQQEEFDVRLVALDEANRIMIQKRNDEETLVWLV